jgi:hypothetical protein
VPNKTRHLLALTGCAAGMLFTSPAALAQSPAAGPPIAEDSPIQADEGVVLAETVDPGTSAAGEASCSAPALSNPLAAFKDRRHYFVAPSGDFEDPAMPGWQLTGGAALTNSGSNAGITGQSQTKSLLLPPGASATSPEMCVDLDYPSFRFFASQLAEDTDAELAVDVIYPALPRNNVREARKLRLKAKDGWTLSDDVKLEPQRLGKAAGWRKIAVRFRVKPGKKPAAYRIDDVLIDPRLHN